MTQQELRARFRVRCDIENFAPAHTCNRACRDVTNRIAARFSRRDAHRPQPPHHVWRVLNMDVVKLKVLARRDMEHAVGIFFRNFRKRIQLIRRHTSERNLDALHSRRVPERLRPLGRITGKRKLLRTSSVMAMPIGVTQARQRAASINVAAASDLSFVVQEMIGVFEHETGNQVHLTLGSSGNFYAQILNGAPFDVFLSADMDYPKQLEEKGYVVPGSLFTY